MRAAQFRLAVVAAVVAVPVAAAGIAHAASPFGIATPDSPGGAGFGGPLGPFFVQVAYYQSIFYRDLTHALTDISRRTAGRVAAGPELCLRRLPCRRPGHGKAVISAYMVSSGETAKRGIALSFMAAFVQALSAVLIVGVAAVIFRVTAVTMTKATDWLEILSYALVALVGGWLLWSKTFGGGDHHHHHHHAGAPDRHDDHDDCGPTHGRGHDHDHHGDDDHHHRAHAQAHSGAAVSGAQRSWRETLSQAWSAILAVGVRPCSGAIIVLVFALSQGLFLAGVAATFVMALGTGLTVAMLAVLAVSARGAAVRLAGTGSPLAGRIVRGAEILAAAAVLVLGFVLLGGALAGLNT
jgi:ABC-type nickel/cobalt efflux system permease component RcnA